MDDLKIVFTTCATNKDAEKLSKALLKADLIACANIIPGVHSFYKWQGKIEEGDEVIVLFKTRGGKVKDVIFALEGLHSYDVPPIEVLTVEQANKAFSNWIIDETK